MDMSARPSRNSLLTAVLALLIAAIVLIWQEGLSLRKAFQQEVATHARIVADNIAPAVLFGDRRTAGEILASLRIHKDVCVAALYTPNGRDGRLTLFAAHEPIEPAPALPETAYTLDSLAYMQPIVVEGREIAHLYVKVGMGHVRQRLLRYALTLGLVLAVALGLAWLFMRGLHRRAREAEAQLALLAHYDELTGLPNRNLFNDRIRHALARARREGQRLALLFVDLDHFKVVNDSMGHAVGDQLLAEAGRRLKRAVRQSDSVCRLGGDEFAVILEDSGEDDAVTVARHITQTLQRPFTLQGREMAVGASVGIALFPRDGQEPNTLLRAADTALYAAKGGGRGGCQFFSEELNQRAQRRLQLESALRRAIAAGEMALVYQPQIELERGRVIGAEALLRWHNAELGNPSPEVFIPVAEESGLIHDIGAWVLSEACRAARPWAERFGGEFAISVNLSTRQIMRDDLLATLRTTLASAGIKPEHLVLEITESALFHPDQDGLHRLIEIERLGVVLALDDFGMGYSSLSYLNRLPLHSLKIDRSFVCNLERDASARALVSAILKMAEALDMEVVAEGVESAAQAQWLAEQGCRYAQGHLYGPPMAATEFTRYLEQRHG